MIITEHSIISSVKTGIMSLFDFTDMIMIWYNFDNPHSVMLHLQPIQHGPRRCQSVANLILFKKSV